MKSRSAAFIGFPQPFQGIARIVLLPKLGQDCILPNPFQIYFSSVVLPFDTAYLLTELEIIQKQVSTLNKNI
jgi:hypothetical protein